MKHFYHFVVFSAVANYPILSPSLTAQNTADACTTCKNFCSKFKKTLSFNALSTAMTELDEYCDDIQTPTSYDTSLCQKHSSLKVSFVNKFNFSPSMGSLCGAPCQDECPPPDGAPAIQGH